MEKNKAVARSLPWILNVSRRFARVDRKGRSAATSVLSTLGICFGVMALIVVMSIMNGFQMSFIDSILEISSYHIRAEHVADSESGRAAETSPEAARFLAECAQNKKILYATPFYEAQALMTGNRGGESAVIIRAINPIIHVEDEGFRKEVRMISGHFVLNDPNSIIIGSNLASHLGVSVGDSVELLLMSGGTDVALFSEDRTFKVAGIFASGYREINASYCFVNFEAAENYFGKDSRLIWGLKIADYNHDSSVMAALKKLFPQARISSWREYNKNFFGVLRLEKNMLLLLVALIFVVVAINIYNGMRRLVFERRNEIAILSALGANPGEIKAIFISKGILMGVIGSALGVILGLLISVNTEFVFDALSSLMYFFQYLLVAVTNPQNLPYVQMNSSYSVYASIPARIFFGEVLGIALFGIFAPFFAAWSASRNVLQLTVSEVLHNE